MHIKTLRNQQKLSAGSLPVSSSRPPVDPGSARHPKSGPSRPVHLFPDRPPGDIDAPDRFVLPYLVSSVVNDDVRAFLQRHGDLLRAVPE